ncbi:YbaK/EbsC family protein [Candidatus Uhrbacteria bacterium]|nr:YbaK/EbsC family protein [Candidatus Uhrbacteria bacterium]
MEKTDRRPAAKKAVTGKPVRKSAAKKATAKKTAAKKPAGKEKGASREITVHLGKKGIKFDVVEHRKVFTAYDLAQTLGTKLDDIAKTLLVEVELPELGKKKRGHYVVVLSASYRLNLEKLKKALKASKIGIATEKAMLKLGMAPGALTPFGSLRNFGVVVDRNLLRTQKVLVGAESFIESLRMRTRDLVKSEGATVGLIGDRAKLKLQRKPVRKPSKSRPKKLAKKAAGKTVGKAVKNIKKAGKKK